MPDGGKFTDEELEEIVSKAMPSYRVVRQEPTDMADAPPAESRSPSLDELRRKYLGEEAVTDAAVRGEPEEEPDTLVVVEPKTPEDRVHGAGQKVLMLNKDGKIIGMQG
jgi:hypothetical protein